MDTPNARAQEGGSPRPRFSSFSIDSLLSGSTSSSSTRSTSPHTLPIITSSVSHPQYPSPTGGQRMTTSPVPTQGAFHHRLPVAVQQCRSLPQKRPRQEESTHQITPSSSPVSSPVPSPRSSSPRLEEDEERCSKRAHMEVPEPCASPVTLEDGCEDLGEQRDTDSPTDSSSGSGSPSSDTSSGVRRKKNRTSFTSEQISQLERHFLHHRYLAAPERTRLARRLELSEQQIKTWFQNRRMKEKRQVKDGDHPSALLMTPPTGVMATPTGVMTTPTSLMMSQIMTSHPMTSQSMAASPSSVSFSAMLASGSPPMMHHSPISGHMMSHEMFQPQGGHYPGFHAPHHMLPGALPMGGLPHPHHYHHGLSEYSPMPQYSSMAMPVMMQ